MVRGAKGRWGVKGHLQNDSYQAMYMHHDNVVDYLEKYDIFDCLSNFCLTKICLFFEILVKLQSSSSPFCFHCKTKNIGQNNLRF